MQTAYTNRLGFWVVNHGSVCMIHGGDLVRRWLKAHTSPDALWMGEALAVEPRFVSPLVEAMEADGFDPLSAYTEADHARALARINADVAKIGGGE